MGLMDKVKQQAGQALAKAQEGVSQGQAKLDQVQAKRQADALLRDLGAAYYARERTGGPQEAIDEAMHALDEHAAAHGSLDTAAAAPGSSSVTGQEPPATQPAAPASPTTATGGNFSIGDM